MSERMTHGLSTAGFGGSRPHEQFSNRPTGALTSADRSSPIDGTDPATQLALGVVLVGEETRDFARLDSLLSRNVIVTLIPHPEAASPVFTACDPQQQQASRDAYQMFDALRIDLNAHRVLWGAREILVTETDLRMLAILSQVPGRACSFAQLAESGGPGWLGDKERIHSAIKRLRFRLQSSGARVTIESVRGFGFRLVSASLPGRMPAASTSPRTNRRPRPYREMQEGATTNRQRSVLESATTSRLPSLPIPSS